MQWSLEQSDSWLLCLELKLLLLFLVTVNISEIGPTNVIIRPSRWDVQKYQNLWLWNETFVLADLLFWNQFVPSRNHWPLGCNHCGLKLYFITSYSATQGVFKCLCDSINEWESENILSRQRSRGKWSWPLLLHTVQNINGVTHEKKRQLS